MLTPEDGKLSGQTAIVTGASFGIGQACAIGLGRAGANVVVNFIGKRIGADETVKAIIDSGAKAIAFECDVSDEAQVARMFANTVDQFGTVDILVNNAGLQSDAAACSHFHRSAHLRQHSGRD